MTKESAAWLAIRVIGLLLLGRSLFLLYEMAVNFLSFGKLSEIAQRYGDGSDLGVRATHQALRAQVDIGITLVKIFVAGGLAFYFLRKGKAVHAMLMSESK